MVVEKLPLDHCGPKPQEVVVQRLGALCHKHLLFLLVNHADTFPEGNLFEGVHYALRGAIVDGHDQVILDFYPLFRFLTSRLFSWGFEGLCPFLFA